MYVCPETHGCYVYDPASGPHWFAFTFLKKRLDCSEYCVYIADDSSPAQVATSLRDRGVDVEAEEARGALRILTKRDTYLSTGTFNPQAMIDVVKNGAEKARLEGFEAACFVGEMTWALDFASELLVEYEVAINKTFTHTKVSGLCLYDMSRFSPSRLHDVLRTHPAVVVNGHAYSNPHYLPPQLHETDAPSDRLHWMLYRIKDTRPFATGFPEIFHIEH